jgi:hypothetical protein
MLVRSKAMLLQFEMCGQDVNAASYTFKLQQAMNFSSLKLKDVRIVCGNDKLQDSWSYTLNGVNMPTRTLTAPLYLTMDFLSDHNVAHYLPAVYPAGDGRVNTVSNTRVDISHALDNDGTSVEAGKRRMFDYTLVSDTQTHWAAGKELTFGLQYRSLENDGQYDQPKPMDDTVWDRTCRLVVTLETDGGHQPPASVPNTIVPLFTADNGASTEPTIVAASYDAPIEVGGADVHDTAFLFAYTLGDSKGIRQHHMGPFTCAAGQELLLFGVQNGSVVNTHRTGLQSIANIDEYLRALTPNATKGYGSIYYANANGVAYSQHNNRYYAIAATILAGSGD